MTPGKWKRPASSCGCVRWNSPSRTSPPCSASATTRRTSSEDADFEPCFPILRQVAADGISIRTLPGGRCLTLVHRGPYEQLGRSYAKILRQARERKLEIVLPTREVYVKGPGMIFKGNPKNYLTEIQLPIGG